MSRRPFSLRRRLAALACAAPLLAAAPAAADTCVGLDLSPLTSAAVGTAPSAVAVGDFNRDGRTDMAVANSGSNSVSILLDNGSGGFMNGPNSPISTGASNPVDIAARDLDQDGILDLVVAFGGTAQAQVLRGEPSLPSPLEAPGAFDNTSPPFALNATPSRIYLGHYTADADLDLVVLAETGQRLLLYAGDSGAAFASTALTDIDLLGPPNEQPSGAVMLDFNRDGRLDLAVVMRNQNWVHVYFGNGAGGLTSAFTPQPVGSGPVDIAVGDVNRDGWPDLVTADSAASTATVLLNSAGSSLSPQASVDFAGSVLSRIALVDLDQDAVLDIAALDDSVTPRLAAFRGRKIGPAWFDPTVYPVPSGLPLGASPRGLALGRFTSDGRLDLVTTLSGSPGQALVVANGSGTPCAGTSFSSAPRGYAAGAGPTSTAAADFDGDGRTDLAVALQYAQAIRLMRNVAGHFGDFAPPASISVSPATPVAVATADLDSDGRLDVAAALANPDAIQVFRGNGMGGLTPGTARAIGAGPSALVIGDFDGNGLPDVAATSEGSAFVYVYLGDGLGGLAAGLQTGVGPGLRALVAGRFNADSFLDLAVANATGNSVSILLGKGDGMFTVSAPVSVGAGPSGIAAADIDRDMDLDLVTVDANNTPTPIVSVLLNDGAGGFSVTATHPVPGPNPTAVALLDLLGDTAPELAVTSRGNRTLTVFTNSGGTFVTPYDYAVRNSPRAITPIDVDADGRLDLAVPCWAADSVVVLLSRPPVLLEAPRVPVGDRPRAIVAADLDADGDLDLAVASLDNTVALRQNDGAGEFTSFATPSYGVGAGDEKAIVAADFNRDGRIDLALNAPGETPPSVSILFGAGAPGTFAVQPPVLLPSAVPDDLAVGDFDRDGDLDLAVCDKQSAGAVQFLRNDGSGGFGLDATVGGVGDKPTAVVAGDFDRDGDLDLAVANDISGNIRILLNDSPAAAPFSFSLGALLALDGGDQNPVAVTAGDFDGDGDLDLAAAAFNRDRIHVYRNLGGGNFAPAAPFATPATLQAVTAADVNLDGKPDLAAVADGLVALRGNGLAFEPPETWIGGLEPSAAAIGDLNRDGRPDAALVNQRSNDVSILLSTTCLPRRLDVTLQPLACQVSAQPYLLEAVVEARDDGGNLAACSTGAVKPSMAPGTGETGAVLGPPGVVASGVPLSSGVAPFTVGNTTALTIDRAGRRYRLQFLLEDTPTPNLPPTLSRPFTLGPHSVGIVGPVSFCAAGFGDYQNMDPADRWDDYKWTVDSTPVAFTPTVRLTNPPIPLGGHTVGLTTRLDGCSATAPSKSIFVGELQPPVTLQILGGNSVCVDCIGGSATAQTTGGGALTYQWGYRTQTGVGAPLPIPGENADVYVLKGASFPGPGRYYVVATVGPTCGPTLESNEWQVFVDNSSLTGEVLHLAASSRGSSTTGENRLLWVNTAAPEEIRIRWNKAPDGTNNCLPPTSLSFPPNNPPVTDEVSILLPSPNAIGGHLHSPLVLDTAYCYSVFVRTTTGWSPGRTVKARPFDSTAGPVKWAYATGGTAVAPPTVGGFGMIAMSNDLTIHSLTRGSAGGVWPGSWTPRSLLGVAHSRSPVVPLGAVSVLFAADDSPTGFVHAVNAETGAPIWAKDQGHPITGAPGGLFTQYGGVRDALFVGTGGSPSALHALNAVDGTPIEAYAGAGSGSSGTEEIGPILGMPAIAYPNLVYFASRKRGAGDTLFCLEVRTSPPILQRVWSRDIGDIIGSPVLRGGRVYVGTEGGRIYSLDALTGAVADDRTFDSADGPVKGFLFPDRRNDDLLFATNTKVWSISDDAQPMTKNWEWPVGGASPLNPSTTLYWPQTNFVYVGSRNGELYELDLTSANMSTPPTSKLRVLGGGAGQIGAPSLDIGVTPKLLIVGSEPGVLYGVEVPFP